MDGNWKLSCTLTYISIEVLSVKARFAGGEMILVVGHSQHLKGWQVWQVWQVWQILQGEIKDEYEAKEDTGFEEGNHEVQTGRRGLGQIFGASSTPLEANCVRRRTPFETRT